MTTMLDRPEATTASGATTFDGIIQSVKGEILAGWHTGNDAEIEMATTTFDALVKNGALAYKAGESGLDSGIQIKDFDATAEQVVVVPRLVGG